MTNFEPEPVLNSGRRLGNVRVVFSALVALILLTATTPARAENEKARAAILFKEGNRLRKERRFTEALEKYNEAYRIYPSFKIDLNRGLTLQDLGREPEAATAYQRFLYLGGRKITQKMKKRALHKLAMLQKRLALLEVQVDRPGAEVRIDGKVIGIAPLELPHYLGVGEHGVEVRAKGFQTFTKSLHLEAGQALTVEAVLKPLPKPAPAQPVAKLQEKAKEPAPPLADDAESGKQVLVAGTSPSGPHPARIRRKGLIISGALVFGITWLGSIVSVVIASEGDGNQVYDFTTGLYEADDRYTKYAQIAWLPAVGPIAGYAGAGGDDSRVILIMALWSAAQTTGLGLLIAGLVGKENPHFKADEAGLHVAPLVGQLNGIGLTGRF